MKADLSEFVEYLKCNDLIIVSKDLIAEKLAERKALDLIHRKKYVTFKELSKAQVFGKLTAQGVRAFLKKHAREDDLIKLPKGERKVWKLRTKAIPQLQNLRP